jgi:hypothetical protein
MSVPAGEMTIAGGLILGEFDAFAGVSLDDGTSWKRTNLSRSADLSSFNLANGQAAYGRCAQRSAPGSGRPDLRGLDQQVLRRRHAAL